MNHSLGILSSGVKSALHSVYFVTNFELQIREATKFFSYFRLQLVRTKSSKKPEDFYPKDFRVRARTLYTYREFSQKTSLVL